MYRDLYGRKEKDNEDEILMKRRERFRRPSSQQSGKVSMRRNLLLAALFTGFAILAAALAGMH